MMSTRQRTTTWGAPHSFPPLSLSAPVGFITTTDMTPIRLERFIRSLVRPIALVIVCALMAGELAYDLGRLLRLAIEARSQQLAAVHCRLLRLAPAPAPVPSIVRAGRPVLLQPAPLVMACAAAPQPAAIAPPSFDGLTVHQLRTLARSRGHRGAKVRDARRADLLLMLG